MPIFNDELRCLSTFGWLSPCRSFSDWTAELAVALRLNDLLGWALHSNINLIDHNSEIGCPDIIP